MKPALIVADEFLLDVENALHKAGFTCFLTRSCNQTLSLAKIIQPRLAIIDVGIGEKVSLPLVKHLRAVSVPFGYYSTCSNHLVYDQFPAPRLRNPATRELLHEFVNIIAGHRGR